VAEYPWMRPQPNPENDYELVDTSALNRWEAMGRLWSLGKALERMDVVGIMYATGFPIKLAADMTVEEIVEACQIRAVDIAKAAGVEKP
jgi:hypothetical protein